MSTIRKTITLTEKQEQWIKAQINSGDLPMKATIYAL